MTSRAGDQVPGAAGRGPPGGAAPPKGVSQAVQPHGNKRFECAGWTMATYFVIFSRVS
jgi:hypothetical protein